MGDLTTKKRIAAGIAAAALSVPLLMGAFQLFGWGGGDSARKAGSPADAQALRDFAANLANGQDLAYTAGYTTGNGTAVTAVQEAPRRAYRSAAAVYVAGPDANVLCRTPGGEAPNCVRSSGTDGIPLTHAKALVDVLAPDFIAPELVSAYLSRLAARVPGPVERSTRDIAGRSTECVRVAEVIEACATAEGVLAHFESPDGRLTLTTYQAAAAPEGFTLPPNAVVTDVDG
ncbi:hypothetical protein GCM10009557_78300 [Virgisporangium ochraceum]|uniref:Lipoprotein n=1 Tax=Virgisporangium ochraceum TaxID=65505 RepID=A0A8J3ZQQ6_9ACTN|nr:hypothetical protein [Virgisporangium ochraceum]GIJ68719.1 hypothetical protein Voc01_036360 [Virgisporangium ochraceum]